MSHAPEPWFNEAGIIKQGQPSATDLGQPVVDMTLPAHLERACRCVNGCAGLNPAAYSQVVEALQEAIGFCQENKITTGHRIVEWKHALTAAKEQP